MPTGQVNALASLQAMLETTSGAVIERSDGWTDALETKHFVARIKSRHDGIGKPPDSQSIAQSVETFRSTGMPDGWRGLKRVCFGVGMMDEKGWCLLSDRSLRRKVFTLAQGQKLPRKRVRCYQSLLSSYFSFHLYEANDDARNGWVDLRAWLNRRMKSVVDDLVRKPEWMLTLAANPNLLCENPCAPYGKALLAGDTSAFQSVVDHLGIPSDSWLAEEATLSFIRAGVAKDHEQYQKILPTLLNAMGPSPDVSLSKGIQQKCMSILVRRYTKIPGTPEHTGLRDAAIHIIGNPWLNQPAWDAAVTNENGEPDDLAREMVNGWLKRRLITDFFELLSADGTGDLRRVKYWLGYEPLVGDMWFALGSRTETRRDKAFLDFRSRARGRLLVLDGAGSADNNAFIMKIGEFLAIEFGATGNACFIFRWDNFPQYVKDRLLSGNAYSYVEISDLKNKGYIKRLIHSDSGSWGMKWEQKFDQDLCPLLGAKPAKSTLLHRSGKKVAATKPRRVEHPAEHNLGTDEKVILHSIFGSSHENTPGSPEEIKQKIKPSPAPDDFRSAILKDISDYAAARGLKIRDLRPKGGALWVLADDKQFAVNIMLKKWGFTYKPGKGWWRE